MTLILVAMVTLYCVLVTVCTIHYELVVTVLGSVVHLMAVFVAACVVLGVMNGINSCLIILVILVHLKFEQLYDPMVSKCH